ncbi:MAG: 3-dehydroquinate synthase family protein [Chitinivibrionales bacterium]
MFKNAFIGGPKMAAFIEKNHELILKQQKDVIQEAIRRSIAIKADVVGRDEREGGIRALLNFGHTFSHALEKYYSYKGILHGEGVFWGIACAIELGLRTGDIPAINREWYETMIKKLPRPPLPQKPDIDTVFQAMFSDKKVHGGRLRLVVPTAPGASVIRGDVDEGVVKSTFDSVLQHASYSDK